ncbi:MAG: UDP-N-acetylmuramoyl-tripeptide--D-alanyl-D-alanine ligase [Flavobacteriales bacterium]|nr:UDP-N-acetylmuramoyl-tripeptide--D-alanyl-D-alanine ligase [Flavobacteriales bacterium]
MTITELYKLFLKSNKVTIDSRKIEKGDLFFGLTGGNVNGSIYAQKAIEQGALTCIIDDKNYEDKSKKIFYVEDSLVVLQNLAKYHRENLSIPIIGLTGSNGKTTTKELIYSVLKQKYNVQYTQGNLNNHIGVPLTVLNIKKDYHEIAIIEMGANHQKEIEFLCSIAQPDYGYITNFGKAHLEGFGGIEGIIKGKSELYSYLRDNHKKVFVNVNDSLQVKHSEGIQQIVFGKGTQYQFEPISNDSSVGLKYKDIEILSHLTGNYNFDNISIAVRMGFYFDVSINEIKNGIENYIPSNNRSQIIRKNGKKIVMDAYNANPSSMEASVDNFATFQGSKVVILGDMFELGNESEKEHNFILKHTLDKKFDASIFIGKEFKKAGKELPLNFETKEEFINYIKENPIQQDTILIKGSRGMALETLLEFI